MNRIEEVKKILGFLELSNLVEIAHWFGHIDGDEAGLHREDIARQICQLFSQPLDDKECSRCHGKGEICLYHYDRKPYWSLCSNCGGTGKLADDKELKLKMEEARKAGFDDGVKKTTIAMDSTIDAQLEKAKKQERVALGRWLEGMDWENCRGAYVAPKVVINGAIAKLKFGRALSGKGAGK